jgi:vacuolar-type H+-ATPase subunit E/Vma4
MSKALLFVRLQISLGTSSLDVQQQLIEGFFNASEEHISDILQNASKKTFVNMGKNCTC